MSDKPRPKTPDPEDTRATPTSASPDIGGPVPPIPGPNSPGVESPHDFVRRRMRETPRSRSDEEQLDRVDRFCKSPEVG